MKKIYFSILLILCISSSFGQMVGELFTGTLKAGSSANSAMIAIKSSSTFTGQFSNLQFTIQVPNTVSPQPTVTIKSNLLSRTSRNQKGKLLTFLHGTNHSKI